MRVTGSPDTPLQCGWYQQRSQGAGQIVNLSVGGCFVEVPDQSPPTGPLRLHVGLPRAGPVGLSAEVVYSQGGRGCGIRFLGLTDKIRTALAEAVAYYGE